MSPRLPRRFDPGTGRTFEYGARKVPQQESAEDKSGDGQEQEPDSSGLGLVVLLALMPLGLCFASWWTGYRWYIRPGTPLSKIPERREPWP